MSDFIKRDDAIEKINSALKRVFVEDIGQEIIASIPSADVAPIKHGRWEHERLPSTNGGTYAVVRCSECKSQFPMRETKYCPNCGARMDGDCNEID